MKYTVDIDNTICETQGNDYPNSKPLLDRIEKLINYTTQGTKFTTGQPVAVIVD